MHSEGKTIIIFDFFFLCDKFVTHLPCSLCFKCRKYGIREDYQYSEILALCRFCCCLFWPSAGHPCIADQSPDFRARLKEAAGGDVNAINEFQPVPPAQFLKYFSL